MQTNKESEQHVSRMALAKDTVSGRFIVADILPPPSSHARTAAMRPVKNEIAAKNGSPAVFPKRVVQPRRVGNDKQPPPFSEPGNEHALDEWFQKERTFRSKQQNPPAPTVTRRLQVKRFFSTFVVLLVFLLAGGYGVSYFFGRMQVDIVLKSASVEMDEELHIAMTPSDDKDIAGELIELSDTYSTSFAASGSDTVRSKARGVITVYNAYNTNPQVLVANTRFEAPDGKIYRIREAVSVPGAVLENGAFSPSSLDITMYADQPGEEYNRGLTDFTIPGFKGSPRYKSFYARSKTPLEGGFIGTTTVVTQQDLDTARESLESALRSSLQGKLLAAVPDGFRLLDSAYEITTKERRFGAEAGDALKEFNGALSMQARALVFRDIDIARVLLSKAELDQNAVTLANGGEIALDVERRNIEQGTLILHARGTARFVWNLDTEMLAQRLAQTNKPAMIHTIFKEHGAIDRAQVQFSPSWIRNVPRDTARIVIKTSY